ncbi:MAG: DNA mismatch repair protein MutS [Acetobacteraceae bacterium]|nr:DNA mismatch repair protein MutS [Acetobacteraceae bacterium]
MDSPSPLPSAIGASPAMAQWFAAKAQHPDALVFFRMGDFYELFFSDAEAASSALDIALTSRGEHAGAPIAMCGVPVHAAEAYLARLIRRGFRVAVAEQMEDPKARRSAKVPIRRDVVRLITPGTLTEDSLLEAGRANYLLALVQGPGTLGAAWLDMSTGLFETAALEPGELPALLGRLDPAEILVPATLDLGDWAGRSGPEVAPPTPQAARRKLSDAFAAVSLDAYGNFSDAEAAAAAMALDYVSVTQAGNLPRLSPPMPGGRDGTLAMDAATRASLEILRARDGGTAHTLLGAVQRTLSAAGARLLAEHLAAPLTDPAAIAARQDGWSWLLANPDASRDLRVALRGAPDMARALGRIFLQRGGPRDLAAIRDGLAAATAARGALAGPLPAVMADCVVALAVDPALVELLRAALADPAPLRLDDGGAIRAGYDGELDRERALRDDTRGALVKLQLDYAQRYGVAGLKIRHHAQLGYVIEVPAVAVGKLQGQPDLTLRQGMANGARFSNPELAELNRRIVEAADRAAAQERAVFSHLLRETLRHANTLAFCAGALARLDVAQSAARLAESGTWCRPVVSDGDAFAITAGRHPVVEAALVGIAAFVPNHCDLSPERRLLLLTGPNMAGKSTFIRQNALAVILAQAGQPVPAEAARIGVVDRLFSRVGGADDLARGRSTFMVEMMETAAILHQAGPKSLVVVDEIGRGTATLDGLAIAWAVLEALHTANCCRTIFATHFHELATLTDRLPRLAPHTMRVKEWKGTVVFLHEVAAGAAGRSWGVHVAELAGVPVPVVRRAGQILAILEKNAGPLGGRNPAAVDLLPPFAAAPAVEPVPDKLHNLVVGLDVDAMTPREALELLYEIKRLFVVATSDPALPSR